MWDTSLLYIGSVILIVAIGFVFALRMGMAAANETDQQWAAKTAASEPALAGAPAAQST
jgi:hypothetical protein